MSNPIIAIVNVSDNTETFREMTDEEYAKHLADQEAIKASLEAQAEQ
jgi:hypothetical protein